MRNRRCRLTGEQDTIYFLALVSGGKLIPDRAVRMEVMAEILGNRAAADPAEGYVTRT